MTQAASAASLQLSYEAWEDKYKPITNHLDPHQGFRYETYGKELEYIKQQPSDRVWTVLDVDGELVITNGFHHVNRLNYVVTEMPFDADFIEVIYD